MSRGNRQLIVKTTLVDTEKTKVLFERISYLVMLVNLLYVICCLSVFQQNDKRVVSERRGRSVESPRRSGGRLVVIPLHQESGD